jgi:hypothetical protein
MFNVGAVRRSEYSSTLDKRRIPRFNVRVFMIPVSFDISILVCWVVFSLEIKVWFLSKLKILKNAQKFYQSLKKETQELNEEIEELNSSRGKGDTKDGVFGIGCHVECV